MLRAELFITSGYYTLDAIRMMQAQARSYILDDIRKGGNRKLKAKKELILVMEQFE